MWTPWRRAKAACQPYYTVEDLRSDEGGPESNHAAQMYSSKNGRVGTLCDIDGLLANDDVDVVVRITIPDEMMIPS